MCSTTISQANSNDDLINSNISTEFNIFCKLVLIYLSNRYTQLETYFLSPLQKSLEKIQKKKNKYLSNAEVAENRLQWLNTPEE